MIFQAAFTPGSSFPSSTKHSDLLFDSLRFLLQAPSANTCKEGKASPLQIWCPLTQHPPLSLLGEPGASGTDVLLGGHRAVTSTGSSQGLHQHLFPNSHRLPQFGGSFSRDEGGDSSTALLPINFQNPGQSMEVFQLSRQLQITYLFIHFVQASFPSQPKKPPHPRTLAPCVGVEIRCCGSRWALSVAGYPIQRGEEIPWSKDKALICSCQRRTMRSRSQQPSPGRTKLVVPIQPRWKSRPCHLSGCHRGLAGSRAAGGPARNGPPTAPREGTGRPPWAQPLIG